MADAQARARYGQGDVGAEARSLAARLRAGHHRESDLVLAAWLGLPAARMVLAGGTYESPRPEWWEEQALEFWLLDAASYAGLRSKEEGGWAMTLPAESPRGESFFLTALLCVTGYWLGRAALLEQHIVRDPDHHHVELGNVVAHEDPPGWYTHVDLIPPAGVTYPTHLAALGYLDEEMLQAVQDVNQRALEALHPDHDHVAAWTWSPPRFWFPEAGAGPDYGLEGLPPGIFATCTCGCPSESHTRNAVGDDVCATCSCIRFEPRDWPRWSAEATACYFAAEAQRLTCFRAPVLERLRANLCYWAVGSYTPVPTHTSQRSMIDKRKSPR